MDSENLLQAIEEGRKAYKNMPACGDENLRIKYEVAAYLWKQFEGLDLPVDVLDVLIKITK